MPAVHAGVDRPVRRADGAVRRSLRRPRAANPLAAFAAAALAAATLIAAPLGVAPAHAAGYHEFGDPNGSTWTVPEGVEELRVALEGAAGGETLHAPTPPSHGARLSFVLRVHEGQTLTLFSSTRGFEGAYSAAGLGGNGYREGGSGGAGLFSGGGGGGASAVLLDGELIAVAAGGGGTGGATVTGGRGGQNSAGEQGASGGGAGGSHGGEASGHGAAGETAASSSAFNGGGGGGGGYEGGGGGHASPTSSSGGGGGGSGTSWVHPSAQQATFGVAGFATGGVSIAYGTPTRTRLTMPATVVYGSAASAEIEVTTVGDPADVPYGSVELVTGDGLSLATAPLDAEGRARIDIDALSTGAYELTARYVPGVGSSHGTSSVTAPFTVEPVPADVSLSLSHRKIELDEPVELAARVASALPSGFSAAGGSITFYRAASALANPAADEAIATVPVTKTQQARYLWTPRDIRGGGGNGGSVGDGTRQFLYAVYSSNGTLDDARSSLTAVRVLPRGATATVALDAKQYRYGSGTNASVKVTAADGTPAQGTVRLQVAGATITRTLSGGAVRVALPTTVKPGSHRVSVSYLGNVLTRPAEASAALTVAKAQPKVTAKLVKKQVTTKQKAQLRVKVSIAGAAKAKPSGTLVVYDGARAILKRTLTAANGKTFTVKLPKLAKGKHTLKVRVQANADQAAATSSATKLTVRKAR